MRFTISRTSLATGLGTKCKSQPCPEAIEGTDGLWYIDFPAAEDVLAFLQKYDECLVKWEPNPHLSPYPLIDINDEHYF